MSAIRSEFVEVVVFKRGRRETKYLILQRAASEKLYPNLWQFVTGRVDTGETALGAARREMQEETGLAPIRFWNVPFIASFYDATADAVFLNPIFAAEVHSDAEPRLSAEHQQYRWSDNEEADALLVWPNNREALALIHSYIAAQKKVAPLVELPIS